MVLLVQFYPVCNFGKFVNFGLGIVRSERFIKTGQSSFLLFYEQTQWSTNTKLGDFVIDNQSKCPIIGCDIT